jgi:hypothetical protein
MQSVITTKPVIRRLRRVTIDVNRKAQNTDENFNKAYRAGPRHAPLLGPGHASKRHRELSIVVDAKRSAQVRTIRGRHRDPGIGSRAEPQDHVGAGHFELGRLGKRKRTAVGKAVGRVDDPLAISSRHRPDQQETVAIVPATKVADPAAH